MSKKILKSITFSVFPFLLVLLITAGLTQAAPPRLSIYHFDVNTGDATLIITPDKQGILIDAGSTGRGNNPIKEFLDRAKENGHLTSLKYFIATHYHHDHIGGADELLNGDWYPTEKVYDRGNSYLPVFNRSKVEGSFSTEDLDEAENIAPWGTVPSDSCPGNKRDAKRYLIEYFLAAEKGEKREEMKPGDTITLDHGIKITALVANGKDIDGDTVDIHFSGRKKDCAINDLSLGLLLEYGNFRYLTAGDLTGDKSHKVAGVEELIKDDAENVDVYQINHHGGETSSEKEFMKAIKPSVVVVSNGKSYDHPRKTVINDRILALDPKPFIYLTNYTSEADAWQGEDENIADMDYDGYDGMIEIAVWKKTYRVFRWRNGSRIDKGDKYSIKSRNDQN